MFYRLPKPILLLNKTKHYDIYPLSIFLPDRISLLHKAGSDLLKDMLFLFGLLLRQLHFSHILTRKQTTASILASVAYA